MPQKMRHVFIVTWKEIAQLVIVEKQKLPAHLAAGSLVKDMDDFINCNSVDVGMNYKYCPMPI